MQTKVFSSDQAKFQEGAIPSVEGTVQDLQLLFDKIDGVLHNLEMQLKYEQVKFDCRDQLMGLFKNAGVLLISKSNYAENNQLMFREYETRLLGIVADINHICRHENDFSSNWRMYFINIGGEIDEILDEFFKPFLRKTSHTGRSMPKPLFFDETKHIELAELHGLYVNKSTSNSQIKLKWNGQKNQLYAVLRQLKNDYELIDNSYSVLADFIKQSVVGFEDTSRDTIDKELKKERKLPKQRRVNIEPNEL